MKLAGPADCSCRGVGVGCHTASDRLLRQHHRGSRGASESLAINHPFVDGNKRVALGAADTFLRMNGHYIECDSREAYDQFMHLFDTNFFRFVELKTWLEEHVEALPGIG